MDSWMQNEKTGGNETGGKLKERFSLFFPFLPGPIPFFLLPSSQQTTAGCSGREKQSSGHTHTDVHLNAWSVSHGQMKEREKNRNRTLPSINPFHRSIN